MTDEVEPKYDIVIAPAEGEPPVYTDGIYDFVSVWEELCRAIQTHPDEHYCEINNRKTGGCILAVSYDLKEV